MIASPALRLGRPPQAVAPAHAAGTANARDAEQFAQLYEAHVGRIHAHIYVRVADATLAEDLTAQAFLRAWQAIDRYRPVPGRPFIAWLFAIANNLIVDHYRRGKRELVGVKGDPHDVGAGDPERSALATDLRDELHRAMGRLKPEHQLLVSLRLVDGLGYEEISAITGKTPGALRVTLYRALTTLREELDRRGVRPS